MRQFQGCQVLGSEPCDGVVLPGIQVRRGTVPVRDGPYVHLDLGRANPVEWMPRQRVHGDAQFFKQLAFQRLSRSLTRFDMAPRKIPDVRVPPATG